MKLGRPSGPGKSKLDPYRPEIESLLANGSTQKFIAHRYYTTEANPLHDFHGVRHQFAISYVDELSRRVAMRISQPATGTMSMPTLRQQASTCFAPLPDRPRVMIKPIRTRPSA
jgi:hypothetical protein